MHFARMDLPAPEGPKMIYRSLLSMVSRSPNLRDLKLSVVPIYRPTLVGRINNVKHSALNFPPIGFVPVYEAQIGTPAIDGLYL
jgi:hypothetical protein